MILKTKTKSEGKPKWTPATATSEKQKEKGQFFTSQERHRKDLEAEEALNASPKKKTGAHNKS